MQECVFLPWIKTDETRPISSHAPVLSRRVEPNTVGLTLGHTLWLGRGLDRSECGAGMPLVNAIEDKRCRMTAFVNDPLLWAGVDLFYNRLDE
jgi:hypothetical protein